MKAPPRTTKKGFSIVPFFGDLLTMARLLRDRDASIGLKALAIAVLVYVASPIDAFPEALFPYIAWIDDVGLVVFVRLLLEKPLTKYRYPLFEKPPALIEDRSPEPAKPTTTPL